jgi:transcriptional regulator with XRE-family HTH domain
MQNLMPELLACTISSGMSTVMAYRMHAKISLESIAAKSAVPLSRLMMIEAGAPSSADEIRAIARALGVPAAALGFPGFKQRAA